MSWNWLKHPLKNFVTNRRTDQQTNLTTKNWLKEVYKCLRNIQKHLKCLYFMWNAFETVLTFDRPTDGPTEWPTEKGLIEWRSTQLRIVWALLLNEYSFDNQFGHIWRPVQTLSNVAELGSLTNFYWSYAPSKFSWMNDFYFQDGTYISSFLAT